MGKNKALAHHTYTYFHTRRDAAAVVLLDLLFTVFSFVFFVVLGARVMMTVYMWVCMGTTTAGVVVINSSAQQQVMTMRQRPLLLRRWGHSKPDMVAPADVLLMASSAVALFVSNYCCFPFDLFSFLFISSLFVPNILVLWLLHFSFARAFVAVDIAWPNHSAAYLCLLFSLRP